ncbi:uncharacterized protein SAPINGB_P000883 [Magnusiomyces paraingens]|uniref:F-box domain-containing protein n=1 Tax=Magnusiomyces paraingens TaxID=2606893 RepID=A0A5E8B4M6_9ASCO|nr:uncharacterized protein SAPINGB_P000883 [Saprochaete ingens]VVT45772.1 unnamed protein product [Saprochaete ingens]
MITSLNDLPLDIHTNLLDFLKQQDLNNLSKTSQNLRNFYSVHKWSKTFVFKAESDRKRLNYPSVPLNVFLSPEKYSWFETKYIFTIRLSDEICNTELFDQLISYFATDEFFQKHYPRLKVVEFQNMMNSFVLGLKLREDKISSYVMNWGKMVIALSLNVEKDSCAKVFLDFKSINRLHIKLESSMDLPNELAKLPHLEYLKLDVPFQQTNNMMEKSFTVLTQKFPNTINTFILKFFPIYQVNIYTGQKLEQFGSKSNKLVVPDVTGIEYKLVQFNPPFVFDYFSFPNVSYFNLHAESYKFTSITPTISIDITTLELSYYQLERDMSLMKLLADTLGKTKHLRRLDLKYSRWAEDDLPETAVVHSVLNIFINYEEENISEIIEKGAKTIEMILSSDLLKCYNTEPIFNARYEIVEAILRIIFCPSENTDFSNFADEFQDLFRWIWVRESMFKAIQSLKQLEYFYLNSKSNSFMPFSPHFLELMNKDGNIKQIFVTFGPEDDSYLGMNMYYDLQKDHIYPSTFFNVYSKLFELPFVYCIGPHTHTQNSEGSLECVIELEKQQSFALETKKLANDWVDNWNKDFKVKEGPEFDGWI